MDNFLHKFTNAKQCEINTLIMEYASDISEQLTELECKLNNIECYIIEDNISSYTDEAQDIFNIYYDEHFDTLYNLIININE